MMFARSLQQMARRSRLRVGLLQFVYLLGASLNPRGVSRGEAVVIRLA